MPARHLFKPLLIIACLTALASCQGSGCNNSGPMGSSAGSPGVATYYYNSNFDTQPNENEWLVHQRGGNGSINGYLDVTAFVSPAVSLGVSVTGSVFGDSLVYTSTVFQPAKSIWLEFDWLLAGMTGENEVVLNVGGVNRASIGYNSTGIYLTNNGTRTYQQAGLVTANWHHVRMEVIGGTNTSSYWLDTVNIGSNYNTALSPVGGPSTDYVGIKAVFNPGDRVRVDNVQAYHF